MRIRICSIFVICAAACSALLGFAVLFGWLAGNAQLIQLNSALMPMHSTTAVCFILCGAGLAIVQTQYSRSALILGAAVFFIACGSQFFPQVTDLTPIFPRAHLTAYTPSKVAPNTALCFLLVGCALCLMGLQFLRWRGLVIAFLGSLVVMLGTIASLGYLIGNPHAYSWGTIVPMAAHTAAGFVVLGAGIILYALRPVAEREPHAVHWLPLLILVIGGTGNLLIWQALQAEEVTNIEQMTMMEATSVKNEIQTHLESRMLSLVRMAWRWENRGAPERHNWESEAQLYVTHHPGTRAVAWVDPTLHIRWIVPLAGNRAAQGLYIAFNEQRRQALKSSIERHEPRLSPVIPLVQGGKGLLAEVPIGRGKEFGGFIGGVFDLQSLFDAALENVAPGFDLSIADASGTIYRRQPADTGERGEFAKEVVIASYGTSWRLMVAPTRRQLDGMERSLDEMILSVGIALTLLLAQAVRLAQRARERAREAALATGKLEVEVTERLLQEEFLLRTQLELVKANAELKTAHEQALQREKLASIGLLAAGVAHEINNPMGYITSNLRTLEKYLERFLLFSAAQTKALAAPGDADVAANLRALRAELKIDYLESDTSLLIHESLEGAARVSKIVQDLKSFARTDGAQLKSADLRECLDSNLNLVWNELKYKVTLRRDYGDVPPILCNVQQLNQVFVNLLMNAADAIEEKGEITIGIRQVCGFVLVSVADTGCGIPEAHLKSIFDPFFTSKEPGKGTGLGLSISYDIVKKHAGEITVESTVGKGSTFTVKLPIVPKTVTGDSE